MGCDIQEDSMLVGWVVVSSIGSAMHFVYRWLGCVSYLTLFVAVNESVWEHLKLLVWPLVLWWLISLFWRDFDDCLHGLVVSEICSVSTMLITYYSYMGIFDYESLGVDIVIFILSVLVGLLIAEDTPLYSKLELVIGAFLFFSSFITLSLSKPNLSIFYDKSHTTYGPVC